MKSMVPRGRRSQNGIVDCDEPRFVGGTSFRDEAASGRALSRIQPGGAVSRVASDVVESARRSWMQASRFRRFEDGADSALLRQRQTFLMRTLPTAGLPDARQDWLHRCRPRGRAARRSRFSHGRPAGGSPQGGHRANDPQCSVRVVALPGPQQIDRPHRRGAVSACTGLQPSPIHTQDRLSRVRL